MKVLVALVALIKVYYVRRETMNKKRAAGLVAALLMANGISGGGTGIWYTAR